ncbi:GNAT family N-acetyltransferase [Streptomyces sp. NPDC059193]|uniref:GNAT family N-acetyltransferase n=1 Tax=Streptomyces sp. NPDC059193 TaxID=3346763 RepID=UPI0036CE4F52
MKAKRNRPPITIRDAGPRDIDTVIELATAADPQGAKDPTSFNDTRYALSRPPSGPLSHYRSLAILAEDSDGRPLGALLGGAPNWVYMHDGLDHPALRGPLTSLLERIGNISAVAAHPDHRGRGVGTELVRHAARRFTRAGYGLLTLNFRTGLDGYYRRLGFTMMRTLNVHLGSGYTVGQQWEESRIAAKPLDRYTSLADVPGLASPVVSGILPNSGLPKSAHFDGQSLRF